MTVAVLMNEREQAAELVTNASSKPDELPEPRGGGMLYDAATDPNDPDGPQREIALILARLREMTEPAPCAARRMSDDRPIKAKRAGIARQVKDVAAE